MGICGKSGLGYEMCEHLTMVKNLNTLFPETIVLSENVLEPLSNGSDIGTRSLKPETIEKCKEINKLAIANEKWPVVAFDNEDNVYMSVFTSKVHYNAKLKRFAVTYNRTDKTLDCGYCTRKIICVHKAMSIWFLEQTHVISHPDLGNASFEETKKVCYDETKNESEECNTSYPPINEAILLEMIVFMRDQQFYKSEAVKDRNIFKKEIVPQNLIPLQEKCHFCNATLSNPTKALCENVIVVIFQGVFKDYISFVKQCLFCEHLFQSISDMYTWDSQL